MSVSASLNLFVAFLFLLIKQDTFPSSNSKSVSKNSIADFVLTAVSKGKIIGYQGKGTGRPIYQVEYYGKTYKVAVTVGSNGYIVGANPR